jgi:microcystin-dependent protein
VGTTYGTGDGSSTFNLPNLADNVAVGKSNNKALGSTGGANTVTSTGNVGGSTANATLSEAQLASHDHQFYFVNAFFGGQFAPERDGLQNQNFFNTNNAGSGGGHSHNMSANFTGDATSVLQPYLAVTYIIKT